MNAPNLMPPQLWLAARFRALVGDWGGFDGDKIRFAMTARLLGLEVKYELRAGEVYDALAERLSVSPDMVRKMLKGERPILPERWPAIAELFGLPNWLALFTDSPEGDVR